MCVFSLSFPCSFSLSDDDQIVGCSTPSHPTSRYIKVLYLPCPAPPFPSIVSIRLCSSRLLCDFNHDPVVHAPPLSSPLPSLPSSPHPPLLSSPRILSLPSSLVGPAREVYVSHGHGSPPAPDDRGAQVRHQRGVR
jgi:hypothetical protein